MGRNDCGSGCKDCELCTRIQNHFHSWDFHHIYSHYFFVFVFLTHSQQLEMFIIFRKAFTQVSVFRLLYLYCGLINYPSTKCQKTPFSITAGNKKTSVEHEIPNGQQLMYTWSHDCQCSLLWLILGGLL